MSLNDFEIIKELGKGSFGIVYLIKRKIDNSLYALKQVKLSKMEKKEKISSLNEIRLLASISHPNIIAYKESFYDEKTATLNLILEYADGGDLQSKIKERKNMKNYFKENTIWTFFIQMLIGLKNLHDHNIMHRDLKSANIFIMKNGIIKLGDLNVAKILKNELLYSQTGTPYYASPEVWNNQPYNFKSDIWSLGCILYELCSLNLPFKGNNFCEVYKNIINGFYQPIPNVYSQHLKFIVNWLLQVNPLNRPTSFELINNNIIKSYFEKCFNANIDNISNYNYYNDDLMKTFIFSDNKDIISILNKNKNYGSERINISKNNDNLKNKIIEDIKDSNIKSDIKNFLPPKSTNRITYTYMKRNLSYQKMKPIQTEQKINNLINISKQINDYKEKFQINKNIMYSSNNEEINDKNLKLKNKRLVKNNSYINKNSIFKNSIEQINTKNNENKEKNKIYNQLKPQTKKLKELRKNHSLYNIKTKIKNNRSHTPSQNIINKTIEKLNTLNNNLTLNQIKTNKNEDNNNINHIKKISKRKINNIPIQLRSKLNSDLTHNNITENSTPMKNQLYSFLSTNSNTKKSLINSPSLNTQYNINYIYSKEEVKKNLNYIPKPSNNSNIITDKNLIDKFETNFSPERNSFGYSNNCFLECNKKKRLGQRAFSFVKKNDDSDIDPFKKMLINPIKIIEHKNMKIKKDLLPNHIKILKLQNSEIIY